ncbi:glutathione S-transferase family protein [Microbacteriaceae bacterium K1510]|nr:glutathione S-transferase family protein [Microbacteriaceae bacterium K1510]
MLKIWGRNNSINVQKVMWAIGELKLEHTRLDVGGAFGKTKEAPYLAMNPNALVPTLEEDDGFILWESNSIVRYLAGKHDKAGALEPKDLRARALASQWMDWQLSVANPAITPVFWGLIRTPPEKRDYAVIEAQTKKTIDAMAMLDERLGKSAYVAGDAFSYGDIPVGCVCYRFVNLIKDRPPMPNLDRWFESISSRQGFKDHVGSVPLT